MGFLSYGSAKGLGVKHDFQEDIKNLYQAEAYKAQIRAEKEQKTKYYAELMKQHTAVAPSMVRELENHYKDLNNQVANFSIEHPNFETDVNLMQEFNAITDQYLNNDFVRKDIQAQEQFGLLKKTWNDGTIEREEYEEEMERYLDWMENGGDGYVFHNPEIADYDQLIMDANKSILPDVEIRDTGIRVEEISETKHSDIVSYSKTLLSVPKNYRSVEKAFKIRLQQRSGDDPEITIEQSGFYKNILDFLVKELEPGEAREEDFITWSLAHKNMLDIRKARATKMSQTYPFFVTDFAGLGPGSEVMGNDAMMELSKFAGEKHILELGNQGADVYVDDPDNPGMVRSVRLRGQLKGVGVDQMKILHGEAYIKVDVETVVDQNREFRTDYINTFTDKNGDVKTFNMEEWNEFKKGLELKEGELSNLEEGKEVNGMSFSTNNVSTLGRMYEKAGFTERQKVTPAIFNFPMTSKRESHSSYTGQVWVKATLRNETLISYEDARGGQAHVRDIHELGMTEFGSAMRAFAKSGSTTAAREMVNDTLPINKTVYLTADNKSATKHNYTKMVSRGEWNTDEEYPGYFVQEWTEKNKDGSTRKINYYCDISTGEITKDPDYTTIK